MTLQIISNFKFSVLQTLNQRPSPNAMMGLPGVQNKMGGINMVPVQQPGGINQIPVPNIGSQIHPSMQGQLNSQINVPIGPQLHSQMNQIQQRKVYLLKD